MVTPLRYNVLMTMTQTAQIAAQVPWDAELAPGWHWYSPGIIDSVDQATEWVTDEPPAGAEVVRTTSASWSRWLSREEMLELEQSAYEWWQAPEGEQATLLAYGRGSWAVAIEHAVGPIRSSADALALLPTGRRAQVLRHWLGYSAPGHQQLLGGEWALPAGATHDSGGHLVLHTEVEPPADSGRWTEYPRRWRVVRTDRDYVRLPDDTHGPRWGRAGTRIARAAEGTPVLEGWTEAPDPAPTRPWWVGCPEAEGSHGWEHKMAAAEGWDRWRLSTLQIRQHPTVDGRWLALIAGMVVTERSSEDEARTVGLERLEERRHQEVEWLIAHGVPSDAAAQTLPPIVVEMG